MFVSLQAISLSLSLPLCFVISLFCLSVNRSFLHRKVIIVCIYTLLYIHKHIYTCMYTYIYICISICICTHRPHSSSFWGLPYRILHMNPKRNYSGAYGYTRIHRSRTISACSPADHPCIPLLDRIQQLGPRVGPYSLF